ncbi:MAG: DUF2334 domain-containing protein [Elusimicrobiota bacterium]|nr:MAG: DUF2334 domain-containing protein [Elusimicrobiota bacterium]
MKHAIIAVLLAAPAAAAPSLTTCVYYEGAAERPANGRVHAIMLENLLGHFREVKAERREIGSYRAGDLSRCDRAAYIGSDFATVLPEAFLADASAYGRPMLWMNYGIWQLRDRIGHAAFEKKTGFRFLKMRGADPAPPGVIPAFYRHFEYKGKRLEKVAALRPDGSLIGAPEIALLEPSGARVVATAAHSADGSTTPYVTERGGFWYVADNPFLFIDPRDRYLILADVLFDFLGLPPRGGGHALVRLEDVHPNYDVRLLYKTVDLLKARGVPFAISVIPMYVAPGKAESSGVEIGSKKAFLKALRYAQDNGGELLLHGYTHDVAGTPECASLGTGAGYEFWDRCRQAPLSADSTDFARKRVVDAKRLLVKAGLSTVAWVTPHYAASPADYAIFGKYFDRVVQRVCVYFAGAAPSRRCSSASSSRTRSTATTTASSCGRKTSASCPCRARTGATRRRGTSPRRPTRAPSCATGGRRSTGTPSSWPGRVRPRASRSSSTRSAPAATSSRR